MTKSELRRYAEMGIRARIQELQSELDRLTGRRASAGAKAPGRQRRRQRMSADARKAVSARMKKYWAERRKAKQ